MNKKQSGFPSSVLFLLGANAVPLVGVLFWDWNLVDVLFAYWAESAAIGFFSILKIFITKDDTRGWLIILVVFMKILGCAFFILHFGGFMAAHGAFLYAIAYEFLNMKVKPLELLYATRYALGSLFLSHGYSFVVNYLIKGERNQVKGRDPMVDPYKRILVMHLTLAFGTGFIVFYGQPFFMLLIFIILKTGTDLQAHLKERKRFAGGQHKRGHL
jgi:hypothetical protein